MGSAAEKVEAVGDREAILAAQVLAGVLQVDRGLEAGEILVDDQIDHAGDRVRTPGGRSAAGHHVHALDQGIGNGVEVHAILHAGPDFALAVDQDQGAGDAQIAQVDAADAHGAGIAGIALGAILGALGGAHHGELAQRLPDIGICGLLKLPGVDHGNRRRRRVSGDGNARGRNDHRLEACSTCLLIGGVLRNDGWRRGGLRRIRLRQRGSGRKSQHANAGHKMGTDLSGP